MIQLSILEIYTVRIEVGWFYTQNIPVGFFCVYARVYSCVYLKCKIYNRVHILYIFCTVYKVLNVIICNTNMRERYRPISKLGKGLKELPEISDIDL